MTVDRNQIRRDAAYAHDGYPNFGYTCATHCLALLHELENMPELVRALRLIRDGRCQCGGRFKWIRNQFRCEQCNRPDGRGHARAIAVQALDAISQQEPS